MPLDKVMQAYYKFASLPNDARAVHKIRSQKRLDCTAYHDKANRLEKFISPKGQLYIYANDPYKIGFQARGERLADIALVNSYGGNLSSLYFENDTGIYAYGNQERTSHNIPDAYLFYSPDVYSEIELYILPGARNHIRIIYQNFLDGFYDDRIEELKSKAVPLYDYSI